VVIDHFARIGINGQTADGELQLWGTAQKHVVKVSAIARKRRRPRHGPAADGPPAA
jgi:hypothetical protein